MHIELLKPHTHQDRRLVPGDYLDLPEPSARWLIAEGAARAASTSSKAPQDTTTRPGHAPNTPSGD